MNPIVGALVVLRSSPAEAVIGASYELILGIGDMGRDDCRTDSRDTGAMLLARALGASRRS